MWPFKFVDEDKERQIEDLMDERDNLRKRLNELRGNRYKEVMEDLNKSSFSFDWERGGAFAVERIHEFDDDLEIYITTTVIGYHKSVPTAENPNTVVNGEWRFYCSQEEHERLVKEFNEYRAKK